MTAEILLVEARERQQAVCSTEGTLRQWWFRQDGDRKSDRSCVGVDKGDDDGDAEEGS
jgi:hypothetical protein